MDWDLLERLTAAPGPSGHEGPIREVVAAELRDVAEEKIGRAHV